MDRTIDKKLKGITAFVLAFLCTMLLILQNTATIPVLAADPISASIVCAESDLVETKVSPSLAAERANRLRNGKPIQVLEAVKGDDGSDWYKISYVLDANGRTVVAYVPKASVAIPDGESAPDVLVPIATGKISGNNVYVRNNAGTNGTYQLTSLNKGHVVTIVGQTIVDGTTWYHITCEKDGTTYVGWTSGRYITVDSNTTPVDGDYADQLRAAGFPESYIASLVVLHEKHPLWVFEAVNTGLEWDTVIKRESANGINLVPNSFNDAMKSTNAGAYNWDTNKWTVYDGSSWVAASPNYIAYCVDPRNFLDESYIFMFESLAFSENQNLDGVNAIVAGSFLANPAIEKDGSSFNYAEAFLTIGRESGVSPYHLASRVRQEQGAGTSPLISGNYAGYEGYYNYFNFGAYGIGNAAIYKSGLTYAKNAGWNTRYKALSGGASEIARSYIKKGQNTLYFEKFNVVNSANLYGHQYMGNVTAAITEGKKVADGYTDKNQAFVFRIPVYKNMPELPVTFTATGNPNNYLKSLAIEGLSITPGFSGATTEYSVIVPNSVANITVSAVAVASTSNVTGAGNYQLAVGANTISINCKAQNGDVKTYVLNVIREGVAEPNGNTNISSDNYSIGSSVSGIAPGTDAQTLLSGIAVTGGSAKILNASGTENTGKVATGNLLAVYDESGALVATHSIVIYGDVNGDGAISSSDMVRLYRVMKGEVSISGAYESAADINRDGSACTSKDVVRLYNYFCGNATITQ